MIRISQLRLPCGSSAQALENKIRKTLRMEKKAVSFTIVRHSIDARKKPQLFDTYTLDVDTGMNPREEASLVRRLKSRDIAIVSPVVYAFPKPGTGTLHHRPVIIGAGPAGLFCALFLAEHGYRPLLIERGRKMEERTADVERFWEEGKFSPLSNVQFGEGGAGTFSDGKLNTQINDKTGRSGEVLRIFTQAGAPASILYESRPHIGTDRLRTVIPNIRRRIEEAGGEVMFDTLCSGFIFEESPEKSDGQSIRKLKGIRIQSAVTDREGLQESKETELAAEVAVLAIGHSARDTIEEIFRSGIPMEQKQFAVGFRVAHPQSMIDESQYGFSDQNLMAKMHLSASPYKLTARASSGRGVYSFCMCPGGYIVNASSEEGRVCVNGMSDEGRDSGWANSAIVITVGEKEFGSSDVLAGMHFQRNLEKKAWELGEGCVPVQCYSAFRQEFEKRKADCGTEERPSDAGPSPSCSPSPSGWIKGAWKEAPLHMLLPGDLTEDFIEGMESFGHKIRGFNSPQALIAGVESRTSSPVRITRGQSLESTGAHGLYPCGEGAGYAGGIMSAAMDGMRIAEAIAAKYAPDGIS